MANAGKTARGRFTRTKRGTSTRDCEEAEELQLGRLFSERMALVPTAFQFNCDHPAEKERLAQMLWRSDLLVGPETPTLRSANTDFVQLMLLLTANTYKEVSEGKDAMWQEGILSTLTRIQSQKVTLLSQPASLLKLYELRCSAISSSYYTSSRQAFLQATVGRRNLSNLPANSAHLLHTRSCWVSAVLCLITTRARCSTLAPTQPTRGASGWI